MVRRAALVAGADPFESAGKKATLRISLLLETHEWLLTCLGPGGCSSLREKSRLKTGIEPAEMCQDC